MTKIEIINKSNNELPSYATEDSAGMDLRAFLDEPITLKPLERVIVPTGIYIALDKGYEAQIRPRSGLAAKNGITVLNTPGTIDADYRGEIKAILINLSNSEYVISSGERICQMVIKKYEKVEVNEINEFTETTSRGTGGFGHTGNK